MITAPPIPNAPRSCRPSLRPSPRVLSLPVILILACSMILAGEALATDVTTQHNNNQRTGANLQETVLTRPT
jgi:hypothetical protein